MGLGAAVALGSILGGSKSVTNHVSGNSGNAEYDARIANVKSGGGANASSASASGVVGDPSALPGVDTLPSADGSVNDARDLTYTEDDYVGKTNVTQLTEETLDDPSFLIDSKGGNLSDKTPTIDPNTEGTTLSGSDYNMDVDRLNVSTDQAAVDTAAGVVKPRNASTYEAATATESVNANLATAATMDTNPDAIVDGDKLALDKQGLATGINEDGSINETGVALNSFAHQNISTVIDTTTISGKLLAQRLGEGNYTDAKATVKGQLDILTAEFTDPVTGEPKIPTWAAGVARNVGRTVAFGGVSGTAATAAMAQALIEATLPIAKAESEFFQTLTIKNLDNKQEQIINKANVLSKMEIADLDNRTAVAVNNAKTFMTYDMANLENEQQAEIINSQSKVQAILEDSNQKNVARRFGAEATNNMNQFYDNLGASIDMFNTEQRNQIEMFNSGEINDTSQFNATMENARETFYMDMQYSVDADNARWRQNVTLTNTEMDFQAAATDVKSILDLTTESLNQLWDRTDSLLDYTWKEGQNEEERALKLELAKMEMEMRREEARAQAKAAKWGAIGSMIGSAAAVYAASDERLKTNIRQYDKLDNGLNLYVWDWTEEAIDKGFGDNLNYGVLAHEVKQIMPDAVHVSDSGYLKVDYAKVLA